jgi:hypothetical protein
MTSSKSTKPEPPAPPDLSKLSTNLCETVESLISRLSQRVENHNPEFSLPSNLSAQQCTQLCQFIATRFSNTPPHSSFFHSYPFPTDSPTFVDIQFLTDRDRSLFFHYISPELLINGIDSEKSRVYSFGAISYPLFSGQNPFPESQTFTELLAFVLFTPPLSTEGHPLLPLIVRCLSPDPNDRPTFSEVLAAFQGDQSPPKTLSRSPPLPRTFPGRNLFCDFAIERPDQPNLSCHRIVLARFSRWFFRWFSEHPNEDRILLSDKPAVKFETALDFFYVPGLKISKDSIIPLILVSYFYEMESLKVVVNKRLFRALEKSRSDEEFLKWVKKLCEANLVYHALAVTPRIASRNLISKSETRRELFQSISPEVLAELYLQPSWSSFSEKQRLAYTEEFARLTRFRFNEIRKNLLTDRVLNWDGQNSIHTAFPHRNLIGLHFDWALPSVTRSRYSLALDIRRANLEMLEPTISSVPSRVNRWFFAAWVWAIYNAKSVDSSPSFWEVEFASRLWGIYRVKATDDSGPLWAFDFARSLGLPEIDPIAFGLIHTESSPPISKIFQPRFCLIGPMLRKEEPSQYFLSETEDAELPWIGIDFGSDAQFVITKVFVRFQGDEHEIAQPLAAMFDILGETSAGLRFVLEAKLDYDNLIVKEGKPGRFCKIENCSKYCRKVIVQQSEPTLFGVNLLRIYEFDVKGHFSCHPKRKYKIRNMDLASSLFPIDS